MCKNKGCWNDFQPHFHCHCTYQKLLPFTKKVACMEKRTAKSVYNSDQRWLWLPIIELYLYSSLIEMLNQIVAVLVWAIIERQGKVTCLTISLNTTSQSFCQVQWYSRDIGSYGEACKKKLCKSDHSKWRMGVRLNCSVAMRCICTFFFFCNSTVVPWHDQNKLRDHCLSFLSNYFPSLQRQSAFLLTCPVLGVICMLPIDTSESVF
jgi:hypothetical protein